VLFEKLKHWAERVENTLNCRLGEECGGLRALARKAAEIM
jgi:hypothetical protein